MRRTGVAKPATKVAVSIPNGLYQAVERARKASGQSRSAVVQDALRHWLDSQAHAVLVREYEAGYRRRPESRREIEAAKAAAVRLFSTEDW
jgi:metal-responsive CopG/Arc/MetJ family transcriptional regulator